MLSRNISNTNLVHTKWWRLMAKTSTVLTLHMKQSNNMYKITSFIVHHKMTMKYVPFQNTSLAAPDQNK